MTAYATLEIELRPREAGGYPIELQFVAANSDSKGERFPSSGKAFADLDLTKFLGLSSLEYGQALGKALFANSEISRGLGKALVSLEAQSDSALRIILHIHNDAVELHKFHWETLCDDQKGEPLFNGDKVLLSRLLDAANSPGTRSKSSLKALVVAANFSGWAKAKDPKTYNSENPEEATPLAEVKVQLEFDLVKPWLEEANISVQALGTGIAGNQGPATYDGLVEHFRQGFDILYLVGHGAINEDGQGVLYLEDGKVITSELIDRIKRFTQQPRLVVLASCESASTKDGKIPNSTLSAALGPQLIDAGIPAVIGMQGQVKMQTTQQFMPKFFQALVDYDGQIDRAMGVAREHVAREHLDYWMPVLFMRLREGQLWAPPPISKKWVVAKWAGVSMLVLALVFAGWKAYQYYDAKVIADALAAAAKQNVEDANKTTARTAAELESSRLATASKDIDNKYLSVLVALHAVAYAQTRESKLALYSADQALTGPIFRGQNSLVKKMVFSADGRLLAAVKEDGTVSLWNMDGSSPPFKPPAETIEAAAFLPNGNLALATSKGTAKIVDATGKSMLDIPASSRSSSSKSVAASADGQTVAIGTQETATLWAFPSGPHRRLMDLNSAVTALSFGTKKEDPYLMTVDSSGLARGWNLQTATRAFDLNPTDPGEVVNGGPSTRPSVVALARTGTWVATGDLEGWVRMWAIPKGQQLDVQAHTKNKKIQDLALAPTRLMSASRDGTIALWVVGKDGKLTDRLEIPCLRDAVQGCTALALMSDSHTLAVAGKNGDIQLFETDFKLLLEKTSEYVQKHRGDIEDLDCKKYLTKCDVPAKFAK